MKIFKKGFTLAEMMVCLAVIMAIAAILLPSIWTHSPNKNKAMAKKTYKIVETSVYELLNDEENYPLDTADRVGLAVFNQVDECPEGNEDACAKIPGTDFIDKQDNTGKKFCLLFSRQLNTDGRGTDTCVSDDDAQIKNFVDGDDFTSTFRTNDGAEWLLSKNIICDPANSDDAEDGCELPEDDAEPDCAKEIKTTDKLPYTCVYVDVNGVGHDNAPNSINDQNKADRYGVAIYYDGKVKILQKNSFANSPAFRFVTSNSLF